MSLNSCNKRLWYFANSVTPSPLSRTQKFLLSKPNPFQSNKWLPHTPPPISKATYMSKRLVVGVTDWTTNTAQMAVTAQSFSYAQLPKPTVNFSSPPSLPFFHSKASYVGFSSVTLQSSKSFLTQLKGVGIKSRQLRNVGAINASEAESLPTEVAERWLLEPVG